MADLVAIAAAFPLQRWGGGLNGGIVPSTHAPFFSSVTLSPASLARSVPCWTWLLRSRTSFACLGAERVNPRADFRLSSPFSFPPEPQRVSLVAPRGGDTVFGAVSGACPGWRAVHEQRLGGPWALIFQVCPISFSLLHYFAHLVARHLTWTWAQQRSGNRGLSRKSRENTLTGAVLGFMGSR